MATEGFAGLYVETRNYGATAAFWGSLGFLTLAEAQPDRYAVVDASGSADEVFERLVQTLEARAPRLMATAVS